MRRGLRLLIACTLLGIAVTLGADAARPATDEAMAAAAQENWPQWRGPDGLGVSHETGFAREWSPTRNIKWKTEIPGRGHSSPVVWGNRVFLTTSIKGAPEPGRKAQVHLGFDYLPGYVHPDSVDIDFNYAVKVLALDTTNGRVIWERTPYDGVMFDDRHRQNTYASPTIVTDGRLVYAFFESLGLYAYDFDGRLQWQSSLGRIIKAGLGPGTSPVLYGDLLILQCDQEMGGGSFIVGLDRRTGREVWRTARSQRRSWATPLLVRVGDHVELVASGAEAVVGYDPATGRELWRAPGTESHPIPSPVAANDVVVLSAGSQAKRAFALRLSTKNETTGGPTVLWRHNKGTAYVTSPVLVGPYVYFTSDSGILTCLEVETGKVVYEGGRVPTPAFFRASPVAFEDVLLLTSEDGDTFVVKSGPTHEILATNSIDEPVWASPALSGGTIYIRGERHLFAIANR